MFISNKDDMATIKKILTALTLLFAAAVSSADSSETAENFIAAEKMKADFFAAAPCDDQSFINTKKLAEQLVAAAPAEWNVPLLQALNDTLKGTVFEEVKKILESQEKGFGKALGVIEKNKAAVAKGKKHPLDMDKKYGKTVPADVLEKFREFQAGSANKAAILDGIAQRKDAILESLGKAIENQETEVLGVNLCATKPKP